MVATIIYAIAGDSWLFPGHSAAHTASVPAPWEYQQPAWQSTLGGDNALTATRLQQLNHFADPKLTAADRRQLTALATRIEIADLTGAGRGDLPRYWPPDPPTGKTPTPQCSSAQTLATSPADLPTPSFNPGVNQYAKVLVVLAGHCGQVDYTLTAPLVQYVYAARSGVTWQPVRDWDIPAAVAASSPQSAVEPASWELSTFGNCGNPQQGIRDRILVVNAFEQMCAAAHADGITLTVTDGYRTRSEQAALFATAVQQYGSVAKAKKWVAYADSTTCTSRHCSGVALDVDPSSAAVTWLTATAGCLANGVATVASSCPASATALPRMTRYGFAAPVPAIPGYLEFTLPVASADSTAAPDCNPSGLSVPNMVAAIFRCRLDREAVTGAVQAQVVAEALVVSRCESNWNAAARAYAGRYATAPNPADGTLYTQTGVFMISQPLADAGWVTGGSAASADPVANINAAASLWLATRGWEQFGCATGVKTGFEAGPVLAQYGGPQLPAWSRQY